MGLLPNLFIEQHVSLLTSHEAQLLLGDLGGHVQSSTNQEGHKSGVSNTVHRGSGCGLKTSFSVKYVKHDYKKMWRHRVWAFMSGRQRLDDLCMDLFLVLSFHGATLSGTSSKNPFLTISI